MVNASIIWETNDAKSVVTKIGVIYHGSCSTNIKLRESLDIQANIGDVLELSDDDDISIWDREHDIHKFGVSKNDSVGKVICRIYSFAIANPIFKYIPKEHCIYLYTSCLLDNYALKMHNIDETKPFSFYVHSDTVSVCGKDIKSDTIIIKSYIHSGISIIIDADTDSYVMNMILGEKRCSIVANNKQMLLFLLEKLCYDYRYNEYIDIYNFKVSGKLNTEYGNVYGLQELQKLIDKNKEEEKEK